MKKKWKPILMNEVVGAPLLSYDKIPPMAIKLLIQKGITTKEEAEDFLHPDIDKLHNPFLMKNMTQAVKRLEKAIRRKEKILLYGDYDVDGTTSVALMSQFLDSIDFATDYYIPDRYKEGYGLSKKGIEYARQQGCTLVIAMDCGIRAIDTTRLANDYGIDLIICDHHLPEGKLPAAHAILDPLQKDCPYPFKSLSGCGVTFKLVQAYCQKHRLPSDYWKNLLDLLVISIAADIVPMTGENRILAHFGLALLNKTGRVGLRELISVSGRSMPLNISDVVFGLAPLINAAGRMAKGSLSVSLLISDNEAEAKDIAKKLDYQNKTRREFEHRITEEAKQLFLSGDDWKSRSSIVLFQPHWHKGVVGIVASRLVEEFHKPTIILTESEGKIVGSARSVKGFDIHQAIGHCDFCLINFGGHTHAAGLTLSHQNLEVFQDCFEGFVSANILPEQKTPVIEYNLELDFSDINEDLFDILRQFAPYGPGNRNPVFVSKNVMDTGYSRVLKEKHLRLSLKQENPLRLSGIGFFMANHSKSVFNKKPFDICYTLNENKWQGKSDWQLMIKDMRFL